MGSIAVITDLRETRRAQSRLLERTAQLNSVITISPDGIVLLSRNDVVLEANPAFLSLTGLSADQVLGSDNHDLDQALQERCDSTSRYVLSSEIQEDQTDILRLQRPSVRFLQRSMRLMRGDHGEVLGKVLYFRDITRETEVDRMKTEFLSTAAHELRTPMASIYGFSELIATRDFDSTMMKNMARTVHRQAGRLVGILNDLLDLTRIEARAGKDFRIVTQNLEELIQTTCEVFVPLDQRHRLSQVLESPLPTVSLDGDKFQQALGNLVSNAFKYSPAGGRVQIGVNLEPQRVGVWVSDSGLGMTPEQVARAFDRFFRADTSGKIPGTGLGLAIVREIVELHGGSVDLKSVYGHGSTVTMWFPFSGGA
ncbi:MAG: PAS domain-containing protein [Pleurocapsa sp. SU_196_0]|nr:PAS domain-containing protein [Pleurocapsa sp. SU_196_0]